MTGFLSLVLLMLLARADLRHAAGGSWAALAGVFLCGAVALIPMGAARGSTARDIRTAPAIANLLFFPMMFLSGSAMPFAVLPDGVQALRAAPADDLSRRRLLERDRPRRRTVAIARIARRAARRLASSASC